MKKSEIILNEILKTVEADKHFLRRFKADLTSFAKEYHKEQLKLNGVSNRRELLIAFFMHFRDKGEENIGMTIEGFVDDYLSNL